MKFFRPDIERVLERIAVVGLIAAILIPVGWGYAQRQQARARGVAVSFSPAPRRGRPSPRRDAGAIRGLYSWQKRSRRCK